MKVLIFNIKGAYAHYKKIYATTSAITYVVPTKTSLYGYFWALACLEKSDDKNNYLRYFTDKQCLVGIGIQKPIIMQRININLRAVLGRMKSNANRKPTTTEYVYKPEYRIYFWHKNTSFYDKMKYNLENQLSEYTLTLGLASLISTYSYVGEFEAELRNSNELTEIKSVIPKNKFIGFDTNTLMDNENEIIEQSMYPVEMNLERNVTEREDILLDRKAKPIKAYFKEYHEIKGLNNAILF